MSHFEAPNIPTWFQICTRWNSHKPNQNILSAGSFPVSGPSNIVPKFYGATRLNFNTMGFPSFLTSNSDFKLTWILSSAARVYIRGECICRYEDPSGDLCSGDDLPTPSHCPNSLLGADVGSDVLWDCCCEVHQLVSQSTGINGYGANRSRSQA